MNDPNATGDQYLLDALEAEYMQLAEAGDRAAFDFALQASDQFCTTDQAVIMRLMVDASPDKDDASVAMWARCARKAVLNVLEREAAPEWACTEAERLRQAAGEAVL